MDVEKTIKGKHILVVDDERDILVVIEELLEVCKIDSADNFRDAKVLIEKIHYDLVVLDIMGVDGYELLRIANSRDIPALMLTAHALTSEDLKRSAEGGAAYFAPKDKVEDLPKFIADVLDAIEKKKSPWKRMYDTLGGFYDKRFNGPDWREKENAYWERKMKEQGY
ncbi:MAG: response regulator [Deltaproteobacteria bacterium HGW-Deltaproteobacteria-15]|jgi:CheY-like chemotaxis protein|nr:MAG: response regulator [Deltaproteobacteria bacterium HGW-Deltaproteobacteria-15]